MAIQVDDIINMAIQIDDIDNNLENQEDTFNYNININFDNSKIKTLVHRFFDCWFDLYVTEAVEEIEDCILASQAYNTYYNILIKLGFEIKDKDNIIEVFYNNELVDFCEIEKGNN